MFKNIKNIFNKIIDSIEDYLDRKEIEKMIKNGDFKKGENFEKVAKELGIDHAQNNL